MIKLVVFDLDNTLAPMYSPMKENTLASLKDLSKKVHLAVASGKTPSMPVYLKNILKIEKKYFLTLKNYSATKFAFNQMKLHYRFFIKEKKIKKKLKII